jgi:hypothetical protein
MNCGGCKQRQYLLARTVESVRAGQYQHANEHLRDFGQSIRSDLHSQALKVQQRLEDAMMRRFGTRR